MAIEARKLAFMQEFLKLQNEDLLSRLERLLNSQNKNKEISSSSNPMSDSDLNERIEQSLEDSKNGKLTSLTELLSEIEKWD
jgi:hypothetical protein